MIKVNHYLTTKQWLKKWLRVLYHRPLDHNMCQFIVPGAACQTDIAHQATQIQSENGSEPEPRKYLWALCFWVVRALVLCVSVEWVSRWSSGGGGENSGAVKRFKIVAASCWKRSLSRSHGECYVWNRWCKPVPLRFKQRTRYADHSSFFHKCSGR